MFEPLTENAPRGEVLTALKHWAEQLVEMPGGLTRDSISALLEAIGSGDESAYGKLCQLSITHDLPRSMTMDRPGLWSNVRLRAGPTWRAVPLITRSLTEHLTRLGAWSQDLANLRWPVGVGCVHATKEGVWIADHLLYGAQDDLENGQDARFYGYLAEPAFSSMTANGQGWGYVQERWVKAVAAGTLRRGWMAGARWFLPLPCHFIPKSSSSDPLVSALFQRAAEVSSLAPTSVHDEPLLWWRQESLRPRGDQFASWAGSMPRPGFGIVSKDSIARRDPSDPCAIPILLGCLAPGRAVDDQARNLLRRLVDLYRINMIPVSQHQWQGSVDSEDELLISAFGLEVTSTPLLVRALTSTGLLPHYRSSSGSTDLPANTILRAGLKSLLDRHAIPLIAERHARLDRPLKRLCWGWRNPDADPVIPGFRRVDPSELAEVLARPGDCEVGGGLAYTAP